MMIAPTEPPALRALGTVKLLPERFGVDIMWGSAAQGLVGVQRKEFPGDFVASLEDGRLATQRLQMLGLDVRVLVLEGRGTWTIDGQLVSNYGPPLSRSAFRRYLCSVQAGGVWVQTTDNLDDTIAFVGDLEAWSRKRQHHSGMTRGPVKRNRWGRATSRAFQLHLIQGIDGVGPELAERILDELGMPFGLKVTAEDLMKVRGVGDKKAAQIVRAFEEPEPAP